MNKSNNKYDVFIYLIVLSLGLGSIGGAVTAPRIIGILLFPSLWSHIKWISGLERIKKFMVFFMIYAAISLIWTSYFENGLKEMIYYPIHFLLFLEIIVFCKFSKQGLKTVAFAWTFAAFLSCIVALWEITTGNHLFMAREEDLTFSLGNYVADRLAISCTFGNYNSFVVFLCYCIPFVCYSIVTSNEKNIRIIGYYTLLVSIVTILIDASRTGLVSVVIMMAVFALYLPRKTTTYLSLLIITISLFYVLFNYSDLIFGMLSVRAGSVDSFSVVDNERMPIWEGCLKLIISSMGFGTGIGSIIRSLQLIRVEPPIPHNLFLEILTQYGFVITYIFIVFMIRIFKKGYKHKVPEIKMVVLMTLIVFPITSVTDSGYITAPHIFVLISSVYTFSHFYQIINKKAINEYI